MRSDISVSKYNLFISFVSSISFLIESIFFSFNLKVPLSKGKLMNFTKYLLLVFFQMFPLLYHGNYLIL